MLLNFSNHPSANWPENQKAAAELAYASVQDLAFPHISPTDSAEEVHDLAKKYMALIMAKKAASAGRFAVHLMGELTFSFMLCIMLQDAGIEVVASTTSRNTEELPDGSKISKFAFVQFREYRP